MRPRRQRRFKLPNDPFFVGKVRDIVGLYLNPTDHAVVLRVDEKTQIQALQHTRCCRWGSATSSNERGAGGGWPPVLCCVRFDADLVGVAVFRTA